MDLAAVSSLTFLFATAFAAATILPFQSEIVLAGMLYAETAPVWLLVAVAAVGNTLGSLLNYWMGLYIESWKGSRWFPVRESDLERAQRFYRKYGLWSLLLSWAPLGDAITIVAGILRAPFWVFVLLVSIAKTGRYVVFVLILP